MSVKGTRAKIREWSLLLDRDYLIEQLRAGMSRDALAKQIGCSPDTLRVVLKHHKLGVAFDTAKTASPHKITLPSFFGQHVCVVMKRIFKGVNIIYLYIKTSENPTDTITPAEIPQESGDVVQELQDIPTGDHPARGENHRETTGKPPKRDRVAWCSCGNEWLAHNGNEKKPFRCPICKSRSVKWRDECTAAELEKRKNPLETETEKP